MASKTYQQLQQEIEALQRKAEEARRAEVEGVISRIKEAIATYGLTAHDLGFKGGRSTVTTRSGGGTQKRSAGRKPARGRAIAGVVFRDEKGNTWGGRGPRPRWLRDALAKGADLEKFRV